ncbi:hypothetical protein [Cellulomonas telluris]|uniref:hypothetical protein n=1 Tax=Cellulomonas telluris TaxID=2306636 RepID=UPI0010A88147|nr:hypothetical protein [Cellulomonas telluris]
MTSTARDDARAGGPVIRARVGEEHRDIDLAPLGARPDGQDLASLQEAVAAGRYGRASREQYGKPSRSGVMVFTLVGGFLALIFGGTALAALVRGDTDGALIGVWFTAGVLLVGLLCGWGAQRSDRRHRADVWRLVRFAEANGLEVQPAAKVVLRPGSIFTTKAHASTGEQIRWTVDGRSVEVAHHSRSGGGTTPNSFSARYLAVQVGEVPAFTFTGPVRGPARPRSLAGPEVVVHGTGGGRRRGKLVSRVRTADAARAFLTDDLVDLLTDPEHPCNAETAGGWFLAYFPSRPVPDAARWRHLFALAEAVVRAADRSAGGATSSPPTDGAGPNGRP